jgi:hypothetical protein
MPLISKAFTSDSIFGKDSVHHVVSTGGWTAIFAWVTRDPTSASEFMKAALGDQGWTRTIPSDRPRRRSRWSQERGPGRGSAVLQVPRNIPDWFHMSMRLRPIEQMGASMADGLGDVDADTAAAIRGKLPRLRYQMWHGKWAACDRAHARHLP